MQWTVWTAHGHVLVAKGGTPLAPFKPHTLKVTYADGSVPKVFLDGGLDSALEGREQDGNDSREPEGSDRRELDGSNRRQLDGRYGHLAASSAGVSVGALLTNASRPTAILHGSLEELYLKNVSTEAREAYLFSDGVRPCESPHS